MAPFQLPVERNLSCFPLYDISCVATTTKSISAIPHHGDLTFRRYTQHTSRGPASQSRVPAVMYRPDALHEPCR